MIIGFIKRNNRKPRSCIFSYIYIYKRFYWTLIVCFLCNRFSLSYLYFRKYHISNNGHCYCAFQETWCRRWWHISQRSLSLSASSYSPRLNLLLMKQLKEPNTTEKQTKRTARATSAEKIDIECSGKLYPVLKEK